MAIDENKLNDFMGKFVGDLGAVMHAATVVVGDTLGLYKALAEKPATDEELAKRTGTASIEGETEAQPPSSYRYCGQPLSIHAAIEAIWSAVKNGGPLAGICPITLSGPKAAPIPCSAMIKFEFAEFPLTRTGIGRFVAGSVTPGTLPLTN